MSWKISHEIRIWCEKPLAMMPQDVANVDAKWHYGIKLVEGGLAWLDTTMDTLS